MLDWGEEHIRPTALASSKSGSSWLLSTAAPLDFAIASARETAFDKKFNPVLFWLRKRQTAPRSDPISKRFPPLHWLRLRAEYLVVLVLLKFFGALPRRVSLLFARGLAAIAYRSMSRLRRNAARNLNLAFPHWTSKQIHGVVQGVFRNFGRLLAEFARLPKLDRHNISEVVVYEGFDNYAESLRRGNGTLFLTAHFGAWELCPFAHALYGYPLKFVVRPIDNPYLDRLINAYRTASGNEIIQKKNSLKEMLKVLKQKEGVGILIDQNTTRDAGVFVDFFGLPACTTTVLAALALRTGATVIPGVLIWDGAQQKHRLHFEPPVEIVQTGDSRADIVENTARFNKILEGLVRQYPDQWLWVHRRWKTRPPGEWSPY